MEHLTYVLILTITTSSGAALWAGPFVATEKAIWCCWSPTLRQRAIRFSRWHYVLKKKSALARPDTSPVGAFL
jgi:hypothetical protein